MLVAVLLAAAVAANAQSAPPPWASEIRSDGWTTLSVADTGRIVLAKPVDLANPRPGTARLRLRIERPSAEAGALSTLIVLEFDCATATSRTLEHKEYGERNLRREISRFDIADGWSAVQPGSLEADAFKFACGRR